MIPFADFLCIQGSGDLAARFHNQLAPDPDKLIAAAFLAPWPRKGRFATSIDVRSIELVKFRNEGETRRSYYQFPDTSGLRFQKSPNGGCSIQLVPGETDLPADLETLLKTWD